MGIKHFFRWFKSNFGEQIFSVPWNAKTANLKIDVLLIDMNVLFHEHCQRIYEYGKYKRPEDLLEGKKKTINQTLNRQIRAFSSITESINVLYKMVNPKKLILCVDGPAPLAKQNQQRQRRFRSAKENQTRLEENQFDSNCLTPGSRFMDHLSAYIDWYIRKNLSENIWDCEVVFSGEKTPGEGEHKLLNWIRKYGSDDESFCIYSPDADLIMLSLVLNKEKVYIMRQDMNSSMQYIIDIQNVRNCMSSIQGINWGSKFNIKKGMMDFILLCFSVGNDFLPNIPAMEINQGGIEELIDSYKKIGSSFGHLVKKINNKIKFSRTHLAVLFGNLGMKEKEIIEKKLLQKNEFYEDELLEKFINLEIVNEKKKLIVDLQNYKKEYYKSKFPKDTLIETICHEYLKGMQWILEYYTSGIPSWTWCYPYNYAPFCSDLADYTTNFIFENYEFTQPIEPFLQLLCVLPPRSSTILPPPLSSVLSTTNPEIGDLYPENFEVDVSGVRCDWEGHVILPPLDYFRIRNVYEKYIKNVDEKDRKRNRFDDTFVYIKNKTLFQFKHAIYGEFVCNCERKTITL